MDKFDEGLWLIGANLSPGKVSHLQQLCVHLDGQVPQITPVPLQEDPLQVSIPALETTSGLGY
ncbi:MAG TPA: hypothetical protein QF700_10980 [Prochlorococcus sp.]|nr:hypothetical protein [Prochlorococcus sp.]